MTILCYFFLPIINNAAMSIDVKIFVWILFSILLGICQELMGHMVTLFLTFWETAKLIYKVAAPFYIQPMMYKSSNFFTFSSTLIIFCFFFFFFPLVDVKWYFIVALLHFPNS